MRYTICLFIVIIYFSSCGYDIGEVKSGEVKNIPYSHTYIIGTDSTLVIVDGLSGDVKNVIRR